MKFLTLTMHIILFFIFLILISIVIKQNNKKNNKNNKNNENTNILHLVLFSQDKEGHLGSMYSLLSSYYKNFQDVKTVFYCFSETINTPYEMNNDILYIRGKETYTPGILDKTILALEYFKDDIINKHHYIIRSNISTIINFNVLFPFLDTTIDYGGGILNTLEWFDPHGGVVDEKWFGTVYGSGTSIFMSTWFAQDLIKRKHLIRKNLVDDLAIGVFVREHRNDIVPKKLPQVKFVFVPDVKADKKKLKDIVEKNNCAFYRNRNEDRKTDLEQMKIIISLLQN